LTERNTYWRTTIFLIQNMHNRLVFRVQQPRTLQKWPASRLAPICSKQFIFLPTIKFSLPKNVRISLMLRASLDELGRYSDHQLAIAALLQEKAVRCNSVNWALHVAALWLGFHFKSAIGTLKRLMMRNFDVFATLGRRKATGARHEVKPVTLLDLGLLKTSRKKFNLIPKIVDDIVWCWPPWVTKRSDKPKTAALSAGGIVICPCGTQSVFPRP